MTFEAAKRMRAKEHIDLGCMQINHYFPGENFTSAREMFDPRRNVEYAACSCATSTTGMKPGRWPSRAITRARNNDPAQKKYVCRVIANLVATGYGKWTSNAKISATHNNLKLLL